MKGNAVQEDLGTLVEKYIREGRRRIICPKCGELGHLHERGCLIYVCHPGRTHIIRRRNISIDISETKQRIEGYLENGPATREEIERALGLPSYGLCNLIYQMKEEGQILSVRLVRLRRGHKRVSATAMWSNYANKRLYFLRWSDFEEWALERLPYLPPRISQRVRKQLLAQIGAPEEVVDEIARKWRERDQRSLQ